MDWQSGFSHMTQRNTPPATVRLLLAVLALFAVVAAACGTDVSESAASRAVTSSAPDVAPAPVAGAAPAAAAPAAAPAAAGGHAYGTTLDQWESAERGAASGETAETSPAVSGDFAIIGWEDLIPVGASGQEIIARFQERLASVEPGSAEATALYDEMQAEFSPEAINPDLDGQKIRLAGFVAPLTYEDELVTEFLLVPNFGACIHVPPPPANQTVMVTVDKANGLTPEEAWGPVWVEGTLVVDSVSTELAPASYSITNGASGVYGDF